MLSEYKLSYTASEIDKRLGKIDRLAEKNELPTKVSDLTNDAGYLTEHQNLDGFATKDYVTKELEKYDQTNLEFANNISDCIDTNKKYILPNGYIYTYTPKNQMVYHNANDNRSILNAYPSQNNNMETNVSRNGVFCTGSIAVDKTWTQEDSIVTISGLNSIVCNYYSPMFVFYYDASGKYLTSLTAKQLGVHEVSEDDIALPFSFYIRSNNLTVDWSDVAYVRVALGITKSAAITSSDVKQLVINIEKLNYEEEVYGWHSTGIKQNNNSVFNGKTAAFYGDSITEENLHYMKGYHKWVQEILGLSSYENRGVSGYTIQQVYEKVNSINEDADIIFIMCGVNDLYPLGKFGDEELGTTYGAIDKLCSTLKEKYPTKIIVVITPHYQNKYSNGYGTTCYDVSKAFREVCNKYAIAVFDNNVFSGIYYDNLDYFTTDDCHWNDLAHELVGRNLAKFMLSNFNHVYPNKSQAFDATINAFDFGTAILLDFIIENPVIKEGLSVSVSFDYDESDGFVPETSVTDGPFGSNVIDTALSVALPWCDSNITPNVSGNRVTNRGVIGGINVGAEGLELEDAKYLHMTVSMNGAGQTLPKTIRLSDCRFTISGYPQKILKVSSYKGNVVSEEVL